MVQPVKSAVTTCHSIRVPSKNRLLPGVVFLTLFVSAITGYARTRAFETLYCMQSPAEARSEVAIKVAEVPSLEKGKPIGRELAGGEAHSYRLTLAAGQFCNIVADQRGIDVVVTLYGPDGPEPVSLVVEASGSYRLEVRSREKNTHTGRYEVRIEELRAATPRDKSRVDAQKASTDAKALRNQRTAESMRRAIEKYQDALSLCRASGDRRMESYSLTEMGLIYGDLGEYQKALDSYTQAQTIYK